MDALCRSSKVSAWRRGSNSHERGIAAKMLAPSAACLGPTPSYKMLGELVSPRPLVRSEELLVQVPDRSSSQGSSACRSVPSSAASYKVLSKPVSPLPFVRPEEVSGQFGVRSPTCNEALRSSASPSRLRLRSSRRVLYSWPARQDCQALPNPSLKLSPNGGPRGPGRRYAVHFRQPGPRVPPSVPA